MSINKRSSPGKIEGELRELAEGVRNHVPATLALTVGGRIWLQPDLVRTLDELRGLCLTVADLDRQRKVAIERREARREETVILVRELIVAIKALVGSTSPDLVKFGIAPPREPSQPTAEERALAVARAEATRKARGTMGPKQKEEIKGEVDSITISKKKETP